MADVNKLIADRLARVVLSDDALLTELESYADLKAFLLQRLGAATEDEEALALMPLARLERARVAAEKAWQAAQKGSSS